MKKLIAVFKREYLSAVRKKMFVVMTFLLPLLMGGFMYVVIGVASRGLGVKKVAVIDGTGALRETFSMVRNGAIYRKFLTSIRFDSAN